MRADHGEVGQRVRIGRFWVPRSKARTGVIVSIVWSRTYRGSRELLFRIRREGLKTVETWKPKFLEPV